MIRLNVYINDGQRSSISLTEAQMTAIKFICKKKNITNKNDYIYSVIEKVGDTNNLSSAIRDHIILELLDMIGG